MKNKTYKSGASYGSDFENKIDQWSTDAKLEFYKDKTLDNAKRRKKDLSTDRRYVIAGKDIFVELKTCSTKQPLSYNITQGPEKRHLKFHQIAKLDYLIVEWRPNDPIVITRRDLLTFIGLHKKNSINHAEASEIGFKITDMKWLKSIGG